MDQASSARIATGLPRAPLVGHELADTAAVVWVRNGSCAGRRQPSASAQRPHAQTDMRYGFDDSDATRSGREARALTGRGAGVEDLVDLLYDRLARRSYAATADNPAQRRCVLCTGQQARTQVHRAVRDRMCAIVPRGSGVQCAYEIDSSLQVLVVLLDRPAAIDSETPNHRLLHPGKQVGANVPGVLFTQSDEGLARVGGHERFTPHDLFFLPHDVQSVAPSATPRVSVGWKSVSVPALHTFSEIVKRHSDSKKNS
jgi:hypothetical protein